MYKSPVCDRILTMQNFSVTKCAATRALCVCWKQPRGQGADGGGADSANEHLCSPGHGRVQQSNLDKQCQEARAEPRGCSPSRQLSGASPTPTETPELQDQAVPGLEAGLWP